jgi:hypothetical protein
VRALMLMAPEIKARSYPALFVWGWRM